MAGREYNLSKNWSDDRVIVLEKMEGKEPLNSLGLVDKRLFSGENNLHARVDSSTMLWYLQFEHGVVPGSFDQQFTNFQRLLEFVRVYYERRNIKIAKVINAEDAKPTK